MQTAVMLLGLTALSTFVIDYGILWTARRQIQNAADAAAMAAAYSLAFDAPGDQSRARASARTAVIQNPVWGQPAVTDDPDITFSACPTGSIGRGACVRVDAYRDQEHDAAMSTIFGTLAGVIDQGVRATATAQVLYGEATDCVRPVAIPDKWQELRGNLGPPGWDPLDTFQRYRPNGTLLVPADYYERPGGGIFAPNGTGYSREATPSGPGDYGFQVVVKQGTPASPAGDEEFQAAAISAGATSPADFYNDFMNCSPRVIAPGDDLSVISANVNVTDAASDLIARDPAATWDDTLNGGRGGVSGGCMRTGGCNLSPRIVPLPAYDPDEWNRRPPGNDYIVVSRVVGFFLEGIEGPHIFGRLMGYPAAPRSSMTADPTSSFVLSVALVR